MAITKLLRLKESKKGNPAQHLINNIAVSLFAGTGILLYILAAVLMPKANETRKDLQEVVQPEHSGTNA